MMFGSFGPIFRKVLDRPGNGIFVVLAICLGVGLPATMFSLVHGAFLRPLPFEEGARIVQLESSQHDAGIARTPLSPVDYELIAKNQRSFETFSAWYGISVVVSGPGGAAEHHNGAFVGVNLFELLRIRPTLGRGFGADDASLGAQPVTLISHRLWRDRYQSDPHVLGHVIRINGEGTTVIGVMPAGFHFPASQEVWFPLRLATTSDPSSRRPPLQGVGRLADGVTLDRARQDLSRLSKSLAATYPTSHGGIEFEVRPYVEAYSDPEMRSYLLRMLAAVFGVFLIACANVANLMAARTAARRRELAIRQALGAGRLNILVHLLTETLLLSLAGGFLGVLLAFFASRRLQEVVQPALRSFWVDIRLDLTVVLFALALTILAGLLAAIVPALAASRTESLRDLRDHSPGSRLPASGLAAALVVAQIALSCGLLVGTGMLIESVARLDNVDLGFPTGDLVTARISLPSSDYPDAASWARFFDQLRPRLEDLAETYRVALTSTIPVGRVSEGPIEIEGMGSDADSGPRALGAVVSPSFFETFGVELRVGRGLRGTDDANGARVAVVDRTLVNRLFRGIEPIGRRVRFADADSPWMTVVGVVEDPFRNTLPQRPRGFLPAFEPTSSAQRGGTIYVPLAQNPRRWLTVALRARSSSGALIAKVREQVASLDPDIVTMSILPYEEALARDYWDYRLMSRLFTAFGIAALCLAMIGLYGIMSLAVARRTHEIGVRIAVGALRGDVLRLMLRTGLAKVTLGLAVGLVLGYFFSRSMSALLFEVEPWNPGVFLTTAAAFLVAGTLACVVPATRASRLDPMMALRLE